MSVPPTQKPEDPPKLPPPGSVPNSGGWISRNAGLIGAGIGLLGSLWSSHQSAKQAKQDRDFQERMSSTSHRREVADLQAAGLNPILSANRGASTPGGAMGQVDDPSEGGARGLQAALALRQLQANVELTRAQADHEAASAQAARWQITEGQTTLPRRLTLMQAQEWLAGASGDQIRARMPEVLALAKSEVESNLGGARRARALAALDEAALTGALNLRDFEADLGEAGPAVRMMFEALSRLRGVLK